MADSKSATLIGEDQLVQITALSILHLHCQVMTGRQRIELLAVGILVLRQTAIDPMISLPDQMKAERSITE
ncbi:MAG: hypothetical protein ABJA67_10845 [Chthonomonadales bacterium]